MSDRQIEQAQVRRYLKAIDQMRHSPDPAARSWANEMLTDLSDPDVSVVEELSRIDNLPPNTCCLTKTLRSVWPEGCIDPGGHLSSNG